MWKTFREEPIPSIRDFVRDAAREGQAVHIGTDSQQAGRLTRFVTVVVILTPRRGGRVAYVRESVRRIASLRERLLREVWRSVSLGIELEAVVPGELTVHIDANPVVTRAGARGRGGGPGLQGRHQAGSLGGHALRGPRGARPRRRRLIQRVASSSRWMMLRQGRPEVWARPISQVRLLE